MKTRFGDPCLLWEAHVEQCRDGTLPNEARSEQDKTLQRRTKSVCFLRCLPLRVGPRALASTPLQRCRWAVRRPLGPRSPGIGCEAANLVGSALDAQRFCVSQLFDSPATRLEERKRGKKKYFWCYWYRGLGNVLPVKTREALPP